MLRTGRTATLAPSLLAAAIGCTAPPSEPGSDAGMPAGPRAGADAAEAGPPDAGDAPDAGGETPESGAAEARRRRDAPDAGARAADGGEGGSDAGAEGGDAEDVFVEHVVAEGETLWDIALAYHVSVQSIMEANRLRVRHVRKLSKGRVLRIPGATARVDVSTGAERAAAQEAARAALPPIEDGAYHFVGPGETLWEIARAYGKTVDELIERNGFTDDDVRGLAVGRAVIVPGITAEQVRTAEPGRRSGVQHELLRGETIWNLAAEFQVGVGQIMAANGLTADQARSLQEGTALWIPGVEEDRRGRVRRPQTGTERGAGALARRLGLGTRETARELMAGHVRKSWIEAAGGDRPPGTLRWPVANGWFVRGYGSGEGGYHLATDIMGEIGWNVRAAAPGIVGYAGNEVQGYGNMVILVHPGGWVTMYAHNSVNFAVAGQRVAEGAIIAELGSTGISRGPHVHFEFIADGRNCEPQPLFRPGVRHRNGRIQPLDYTTWTDPDERPSSVHCAPRRHHPRSRWVIDENPEDAEPAAAPEGDSGAAGAGEEP